MDEFRCEDLDPDVLEELIEDIQDHYVHSEQALIALDSAPSDGELLNGLFRSVHTIKGNLGVVGFYPLSTLMDAVEDMLGWVRRGSLSYSPMLGDLLLLLLDRVRLFVVSVRDRGFAEYDQELVEQLCASLKDLGDGQVEAPEQRVAQAIRLLDPSVVEQERQADEYRIQQDDFLQGLSLDQDEDLQFFRDLIEPIEKRSAYWLGRSDRIVRLALILNQLAGRPVEVKQLAVAVYAHDFGMALMPLELLHKDTALSPAELQLMRSHVHSSAQLLLHMPHWREAREMVLHHHEAVDGSGYPYGLLEEGIHEGAKIIAVADTFDAMTRHRAYSSHQKRPILRAIKEINALSGRQLSAHWVEMFNRAIQPVLLAHRASQL